MEETKSNWSVVGDMMRGKEQIDLGKYASYWMHRTPRRMLHCLSYYKFAAKMIGHQKKVLDIGCNEGMGTYLLSQECGSAVGVDFDEEAIEKAKKNFESESLLFRSEDILTIPNSTETYDAVVNFDVIEHICPENVSSFWQAITRRLSFNGIAVVGTPSLISQKFASEVAKKGHVNIYSHERLYAEMSQYFEFVFLFSANDEVVHTGFLPLAHYFLALGCKKKG